MNTLLYYENTVWACDVCLYIYTSGGAARRRYRHTSQQPNRPKNTKNNRAPKKYRRTFWEEEAERSNRGGLRKQTARKAQFTATRARRSGAFALTRFRIAPRIPPRRFPIFSPRFSSLSASSLSFLCSPVPCIRPRSSSRKSPRG